MTTGTVDLAKARDTVSALLDELGLAAYLFDVEPGDRWWQVKVECAISHGWESVMLEVERQALLSALDDASLRQRILTDWRQRLAECKCLLN
jgi:hypothetical protein